MDATTRVPEAETGVFRVKRVEIVTIPGCSLCTRAVAHVTARGISPVVRTLERESVEVDEIMERTGSRTFPQIFVGPPDPAHPLEFIGGFHDLKSTALDMPTEFRRMEISGEVTEPICAETTPFDRFILFNGRNEAKYAKMEAFFQLQTELYWTKSEIDMSQDLRDWDKKIDDNEKRFITHILAFFSSLDQMVMENIGVNFADEIKVAQIRNHLTFQAAMEVIHADTYSMLIQALIRDRDDQLIVFQSIQKMPIIEKKAVWVERWMRPETASLAERLVAFMCLEGIQFSGSFCAIYWLKKRSLFPGLCMANELIARDEGIHADASVEIYRHLRHKLPAWRVLEIVDDAVELEREFVQESLPVSLLGINASTMSDYIRFVADFWLDRLGYDKAYHVANPFEWMELISLQGKTNFFEKRVSEYSKAGVGTDNSHKKGLDINAAF